MSVQAHPATERPGAGQDRLPSPWTPAGRGLLPPSSARWFGRLLTPLRRVLWRLLGLPAAIERSQRHTAQLLLLLHHLGDGGPALFRPGTRDWDIFYSVVVENEYHLPEAFGPDDVLVDIGTHIGSFALAALLRGAGRVCAFEAEAGNHRQACRLLRLFGDRARVHRRAVWRSDRPADVLYHTGYSDAGSNTGGGSVLWGAGEPVPAVALDEALREVTEEGRRRVRLLKLDCEGSEYPILLTSRLLHLVDAVCGEYHDVGAPLPEGARIDGVDRFTPEVLEDCLRRNGFHVQRVADPGSGGCLGKFFATRVESPSPGNSRTLLSQAAGEKRPAA